MNVKHNLLKVTLAIAISIAFTSAKAQQPYAIQGNLGKNIQGKVLINFNDMDRTVNDSIAVKNGEFLFKGTITEPERVRIMLKYASEAEGASEVSSFFLEPGNVTIKSTGGLKDAVINGGKSQTEYNMLSEALKTNTAAYDRLNADYKKNKAEGNQEEVKRIVAENHTVQAQKKEIMEAFVKNHPESFVSFRLWSLDVPSSPDAEVVEPGFNKFSATIRNSKSGKLMASKIDRAKKLMKGKIAPDFTLPDTLGNKVSLSSFKGKNVVLCFWQRFFYPFESFAFEMTRMNRQLKADNVVIVSVYYNPMNQKADWKELLKENNMNNWVNLNDEPGIIKGNPVSDVAKAYNLDGASFPKCMVIGPDGKILDSHINFAQDPIEQIKALLTK